MMRCLVAVALVAAATSPLAQDRGLRLERDGASPWKASLESASGSISGQVMATRPSLRLTGDYWLGELRFGNLSLGSLRISGGLLHGPQGNVVVPQALSAHAPGYGPSATDFRLGLAAGRGNSTWSYLGVGYATTLGAIGVQADLGLAAQNPAAAGLSRLGDTGLDSLVRDLRLTPVLRLGMSYRF